MKMIPYYIIALLLIWSIITTEKLFDLREDLKNNVIKFDDHYYLCHKLASPKDYKNEHN